MVMVSPARDRAASSIGHSSSEAALSLGLDIGTTGCKAGLFDAEGRLLTLAYREYPLLTPERGWAEIDSREVCAACATVIQEAAAACPKIRWPDWGFHVRRGVHAVAADGRILGNGMVSSDARAERSSRPGAASSAIAGSTSLRAIRRTRCSPSTSCCGCAAPAGRVAPGGQVLLL